MLCQWRKDLSNLNASFAVEAGEGSLEEDSADSNSESEVALTVQEPEIHGTGAKRKRAALEGSLSSLKKQVADAKRATKAKIDSAASLEGNEPDEGFVHILGIAVSISHLFLSQFLKSLCSTGLCMSSRPCKTEGAIRCCLYASEATTTFLCKDSLIPPSPTHHICIGHSMHLDCGVGLIFEYAA